MITVKNVNFEYDDVQVLHDVSFSIPKGSITALVGPNGAGKTTLMRCIAGLDLSVSGNVTVDGIDVFENPRDAHCVTGYLSDFFGLHDALTVEQHLIYIAGCHNIPKNEVKDLVTKVSNLSGLENHMKVEAGALSRGYRQRLGVGLSLLHSPKVLLLDEPASGMDPETRIKLSRLMKDLKKEGYTIIVSSHILAELEDYCTDMLVIREGHIVEHVRLKDYEQLQKRTLRLGLLTKEKKILDVLSKQKEILNVTESDQDILCEIEGDKETAHKLLKRLIGLEVPIYSYGIEEETLQDLYMDIAEKQKGALKK